MDIIGTLKGVWRPLLAFSLIIMLWFHYIVAPMLGKVPAYPLPSEFWTLMTVFCGVYAGGRSLEKTKTKE